MNCEVKQKFIAGHIHKVNVAAVIIYIRQSIAVVKRIFADESDAAADGNGSQSIAVVKRIAADGSDAVGYGDARQRRTVAERRASNQFAVVFYYTFRYIGLDVYQVVIYI